LPDEASYAVIWHAALSYLPQYCWPYAISDTQDTDLGMKSRAYVIAADAAVNLHHIAVVIYAALPE